MKQVVVTYQMTRKTEDGRETKDACLTLSMCDENAEELLTDGEESSAYLVFVYDILENLSQLQEYDYVGFCDARLAGEEAGTDDDPRPRYHLTWCDFQGGVHETCFYGLKEALAARDYLKGGSMLGSVELEEIKPGTAK